MKSKTVQALGLIGLATKAGKTITGAQGCENAIKNDKAELVILAADASENTKIPIIRLCRYKEIILREFADKESLGKYTGSEYRAIIVINDKGLANRILELIDDTQSEEKVLED